MKQRNLKVWGVWCCALGQSFAGDLPVRINKAFSLVYLFIDVCACFPLKELNSSGLENVNFLLI